MPKFDFNLEAVLTVRKNAERERQRALGVLLSQMAELERELRRMDEEVKVAGQELREGKLTGPVDVAFLAGHRRFVLAMERNARAVIQKMGILNRQIEEARGLLVEAARARKVVEKLRERKFEAWRADLLKKEQAEIDEVGGTLTILEWQKQAREAGRTEVVHDEK
jgi:flagellar FliJ protein